MRRPAALFYLALLLLPACGLTERLTPVPTATSTLPSPTLPPTMPATPALPTATIVALPPDTGWEQVRPGLEQRWITLRNDDGALRERLFLVRVEPSQFRFEIGYRPGEPLSLAEWQEATGALLVINAGFFTPAFEATGLIIADGESTGISHGNFAGMLAISGAGPELRWLALQPYNPAEPLLGAIQSFPLLVKPGGELGFPEEDGVRSRRAAVAQDRHGRFIFLVAGTGSFTLHALSRFLVESDLDLDIALNLDGGTSAGMLLAEPAGGIDAFIRIPAVITVNAIP